MLVRLALFSCVLATAYAEESHWAYSPPQAQEISADSHPVDLVLKGAWKEANLAPAAQSPPHRWLERAAYTLTGLTPTSEQLQRLSTNPTEETWSALIDELLASPNYGERWARHWMDVARYADTRGYNFDKDNRYPYAYTYRNWLIKAFNDDLPYDEFVKLQIAADLLVDKPDHPHLAALGLLTVGPRSGTLENIDDRVDVITRGFLSTTVSCARCHDHKTDPISQQDYYSFYSIIENTHEETPVIGQAPDQKAFKEFTAKKNELERKDHAVKQAIIDQMRSRETLATYLELAWRAKTEQWDNGRASAEGFKRGRFRPNAIMRWRDFINAAAEGDKAIPRLAAWMTAMKQAPDKSQPCLKLADDWIAEISTGGDLANVAKDKRCPLSYDTNGIRRIFDQQDNNEQRARESAMARLETEHPGAPPRAMAIRDRDKWAPAQVYERGNPSARGEPFERHWLTILGGGPYPTEKNARLAMAERIADRNNPLTARVIVNRVWAWHFGTPLANPGDFGPQQPAPPLQPLLDTLAVWFMDHGWSIKELHRHLLTSQAFRLSADRSSHNEAIDEANSLFWRWTPQRLDFESARDRLLHSSGSLDLTKIGGRSINLAATSSNSRRSLYAFLDRYALPGLFVNFDVPHPDHHAPRRIQTIVPQQALYFLNNTLPVQQAAKLANAPAFQNLPDDEARVRWIYQHLFRRTPSAAELNEATGWIKSADNADYAPQLGGHWQIGYRSREAGKNSPLRSFPIFDAGQWKTGKELSSAPIPFLHAGPNSGHASHTHDLVLRWIAHGSGQVRMTGPLKRTQEGGVILHWDIRDKHGKSLQEADLPPESKAKVSTPWIKVQPGDTLDFVLSGPNGATCGGVSWKLNITGRESARDEEREVSNLKKQFPINNSSPALPTPGSPWPDLIQALWASNEFNFIN